MAKDKERQMGYYYYVEKNRSAKEASLLSGVTEATFSAWVRKFGWKSQREARAMSCGTRTENIKQLIDELAAQRIALGRELDLAVAEKDDKLASDIRRQLAAVDDGAAKWNKALAAAAKEGKITLTIYLDVMEQIFGALRNADEHLYLQTLSFQEQHIHEVSIKL